ncbi:epoxide hydrolase [Myxococcota bacterium]|nr:epoxide hydrolase [Myxococcota bacterium]
MSAERFRVEIPQAKLDVLSQRLDQATWPHDYENDDWSYGTNASYLRELVNYWQSTYDWRSREAALNQRPHFRAKIDGLPIHFVHERGVGPAPIPIVLTHGWPWSFMDFDRVVGPLVDPAAHGGDAADAFDVVIPSLPGFTFSTPLDRSGIHWASTADLWVKLMRDVLGYPRFAAHGGDWGALVTLQLGHAHAAHLIGIHATNAFPMPPFGQWRPWMLGGADLDDLPADEREGWLAWERKFASHVAVHMLDPQTLAYALHDSPLALCAWLLERRRAWSDCGGDVESRFSKQHLIDTTMLYWLTGSPVTSMRYYAEAARHVWEPAHQRVPVIEAPTGLSLFRFDMPPGPTDWAQDYFDLRLMNVRESGGHFAAYEEPEAVVADIRETFRGLR